jgi:hypothetical protein
LWPNIPSVSQVPGTRDSSTLLCELNSELMHRTCRAAILYHDYATLVTCFEFVMYGALLGTLEIRVGLSKFLYRTHKKFPYQRRFLLLLLVTVATFAL